MVKKAEKSKNLKLGATISQNLFCSNLTKFGGLRARNGGDALFVIFQISGEIAIYSRIFDSKLFDNGERFLNSIKNARTLPLSTFHLT